MLFALVKGHKLVLTNTFILLCLDYVLCGWLKGLEKKKKKGKDKSEREKVRKKKIDK